MTVKSSCYSRQLTIAKRKELLLYSRRFILTDEWHLKSLRGIQCVGYKGLRSERNYRGEYHCQQRGIKSGEGGNRLYPRAWAILSLLRFMNWCKSRDSSVGIALCYGLDHRGSRVRFPKGLGNFLFTITSRTALGPTQPPIHWVPAAPFLGVKRPGREADH
jgi:hypothetical protein